jgi:hypothetical protein
MVPRDGLYRPLSESLSVRLLRLECRGAGSLRATLLPTRICQASPYHALSYCWGTGSASSTIYVNDYALSITPSLAEALLVLRTSSAIAEASTPGFVDLWIDQICIDQTNWEERSQQVAIMKEIYSSAVRTVIWLGSDDGFAETAFALCRSIHTIFLRENSDAHSLTQLPWKPFNEQEHQARGLPELEDSSWKHLQALFQSPWFRRLWIFQEVVLSSKDPIVLCGRWTCSWECLSWSACWLWNYGYFDHGIVPISVSAANSILEVTKTNGTWDVGALVHMSFGYFKATDARDKIYGLLGMRDTALNQVENSIPVNYCLDPHVVYRDAAWHIISSTKNLAVLSKPLCRTKGISDPYRYFGRQRYWNNYVSWTPNFDYFIGPNGFTDLRVTTTAAQGQSTTLIHRPLYRAAKSLAADVRRLYALDGKDNLFAKGLRVDTIQECLEINTPRGLSLQVLRFTKWPLRSTLITNCIYILENSHLGRWRLGLHYLYSYMSGLRRPAVLRMWETALRHQGCADITNTAHSFLYATTAGITSEHKPVDYTHLADMCVYLLDLYQIWGPRRCNATLQHSLEFFRAHARDGEPERYRVAMEQACVIRRFFTTKQGHLGVGSTGLKAGDTVCVLFGGGVPFILRSKESHWLLIGDAYIAGLMEGQAVDAWHQGLGLAPGTFEIR